LCVKISSGSYVKGKCFVFLYFAISETIRFPIGWKVYIPKEKTKYTIALELIDEAIAEGFKSEIVLVDGWYAIAPFLGLCIKKAEIYR
jgi:SRSO17 transposase